MLDRKTIIPLLVILAVHISNPLYGQRQCFIGYPNHIKGIEDSAKIILDKLPFHGAGFSEESAIVYFTELKIFMLAHPDFKCNILLFDADEDAEKRMAWTSRQAKILKEYLIDFDVDFYNSSIQNIIPHRERNPLFGSNAIHSTNEICCGDMFYLKQCVIIELIRKDNNVPNILAPKN